MAFIVTDTNYNLSEADVNTTSGVITTKGPLPITGLLIGTVVLAAQYDSTIPGWRLLIANPE